MRRRLISAGIIVPVMIFLTWFDFYLGKSEVLGCPGIVLTILCLIVSVLAGVELAKMWRTDELKVKPNVLAITMFVMTAFCCVPFFITIPENCPVGNFGWAIIGLICAFGTIFVYEMRFGDHDRTAAMRVAFYVLGLGYMFILFAFLASHRLIDRDNQLGIFTIVSLITTVKLSDGMAYFVGKAFGTTKMAPRLSPGKTVQGAFGGLAGGVGGAFLMMYVIAPYLFVMAVDKSTMWVVVYGLVLTIAGMFGDLAESFLKRSADCKDSSSAIPGLGGILDVTDSLIAAAPVSFFMWLI